MGTQHQTIMETLIYGRLKYPLTVWSKMPKSDLPVFLRKGQVSQNKINKGLVRKVPSLKIAKK